MNKLLMIFILVLVFISIQSCASNKVNETTCENSFNNSYNCKRNSVNTNFRTFSDRFYMYRD